MKHDAKRAGLHYDLRFRMPDSVMWASFAVPKGVPTNPGKKVSAFRTKDHSRRDALLTGRIKDGYGTGMLRSWDLGKCNILKYTDDRIVLELFGRKVKGIYHLISIAKPGVTENKTHLLFKSKKTTWSEGCGMVSRIPSAGEAEDVEEGSSEQTTQSTPDLPWDKVSRKVVKYSRKE
jgi:hypothetical protein